MKLWRALICTLCLVGMSGCWWEDKEAITFAVWADDDSAQAYVHAAWEEKHGVIEYPFLGSRQRRNEVHKLVVQNPDGTGRRAVTGFSPGRNASRLYYMKSAGYLLVALYEGSTTGYQRVDLDGSVRTAGSSAAENSPCASFEMIPSPDGSLIAMMLREHPTQTQPTDPSVPVEPVAFCDDAVVEVTFLDADTLQPVHPVVSWAVNKYLDATWDPQGDFYVSTLEEAWRVTPGGRNALPVPPPGCMFPKTTSSTVSASGTQIRYDSVSRPVVESSGGVAPFGCQ